MNEILKLQVELTSSLSKVPKRKYPTDAGLDISSAENVVLYPNQTCLIKTGLKIKLPVGYFALVVPRSSFRKQGLIIHSVIDEGYTGDLDIIVSYLFAEVKSLNRTIQNSQLGIEAGERFAQLLILPVPKIEVEKVVRLQVETERGEQGFGSTGKD